MNSKRVLIKLIKKDGSPKLYTESLSKIHPETRTTVKAGDWQYKIMDEPLWNVIKVDHSHEFEFVRYIGFDIIGSLDLVITKIIPENIPEVRVIEKKIVTNEVPVEKEVKVVNKKIDTNKYTYLKFKNDIDSFTKAELKEFAKEERSSIKTLAIKKLKDLEQ